MKKILLALFLTTSILAIPSEASNIGTAKQFIGMHETSALAARTLHINASKVPWCTAFANHVVKKNGKKGTGSLAATSFLSWGKRVTSPIVGDIVVLKTKYGHHVGFFAGFSGGKVLVLGGNQSNRVKVSSYSRKSVIGYRRG